MQITADKLKEMGFETRLKTTRDLETDNFDTIKFVTHSGKITGIIELEVTETYYRAEELEDAWQYDSISVELVMNEYSQELPISDFESFNALVGILTGVEFNGVTN